jgi:hypothetical protein
MNLRQRFKNSAKKKNLTSIELVGRTGEYRLLKRKEYLHRILQSTGWFWCSESPLKRDVDHTLDWTGLDDPFDTEPCHEYISAFLQPGSEFRRAGTITWQARFLAAAKASVRELLADLRQRHRLVTHCPSPSSSSPFDLSLHGPFIF